MEVPGTEGHDLSSLPLFLPASRFLPFFLSSPFLWKLRGGGRSGFLGRGSGLVPLALEELPFPLLGWEKR